MRIIICYMLLLLSCFQTMGQSPLRKIITGRIISKESNDPLAGVTIILKHQKGKTISDYHGNFSIVTSEKIDTMLFSYVGYILKQVEVRAVGNQPITISMEKAEMNLTTLEVISTGFQKIPKERATGSFTSINNKLYNEQVGTNAIDRLQYISNGVTSFPQRYRSGNNFTVRGLSTLTMTISKPLIIIDNFEYQGDISNINPGDVENVTFLKDAAAGSIWGARAANGVVVITTKKGRFNQNTKVELSSSITIVDKPDLFYIPNIGSSDLVDVEQYLFSQNYRFRDTSRPNRLPFSPVYETLFRQKNGQQTAEETSDQLNKLRGHDVRNDFLQHFYQKAINQQYYLSLRGGTSNLAWLLSGGFDKNISELDAQYNRLNIRFENTYKPSSKIEINISAAYTNAKSNIGKPGYGDITTVRGAIPTYSSFTDINGNPLPLYKQYRQTFIDTIAGGKLLDWKYYPLEDYRHVNNNSSLNDINAVLGIKYMVSSIINLDLKYRYEKQQSDNNIVSDMQSYYTRDLVNSFSNMDYTTGNVSYSIPIGSILDQNSSSLTAQNLRGQFDVNKDWKKSSINAIAGAEITETINNNYSSRVYGYNPDILTYGNVDYANTHTQFIGGGESFIPNNISIGKTNYHYVSLYFNAAYTYNNKYTFSMSSRKDASNLFGVSTNDKWKPLWSTGVSWNISKEQFYPVTFPYLKIRVSYGKQGNLDPSKVAVTTLSYVGTNPYTITPYGQVNNFPNPELRWEQTAMFNTGIDFSNRNRRITGSIEFYRKKMTDLYGSSLVDPTAGLAVNTITKNVGNMLGHGIDIHISTINVDRKIKWASDIIINTYKDKVIKLNPVPDVGTDIVGGGLIGVEGYPAFSYFAYKWAGLDQQNGDPIGFLKGEKSKDYESLVYQSKISDLKYIGPLLPTVFGSLGNTITWNNFSLTARIMFKFGYYFRRESINYTSLVEQSIGHSDYALRWKKSGDETTTNVPSFPYPINNSRDIFYTNSEILATKGDNIRIQYINLSYNLSKQVYSKLPVNNIQLYVNINNIGIIWKANNENIDPDFKGVPPSRSIALGCRIDF